MSAHSHSAMSSSPPSHGHHHHSSPADPDGTDNLITYWQWDNDEHLGGDRLFAHRAIHLHASLAAFALVFLLPLALALRHARSQWYPPLLLVTTTLTTLAMALGWIYAIMTPGFYPSSHHGLGGWVVVSGTLLLALVDLWKVVRKIQGGWLAKTLALFGYRKDALGAIVPVSAPTADEESDAFAFELEPPDGEDDGDEEEGQTKEGDEDSHLLRPGASTNGHVRLGGVQTAWMPQQQPDSVLTLRTPRTAEFGSLSPLRISHSAPRTTIVRDSFGPAPPRPQACFARGRKTINVFLWRSIPFLSFLSLLSGVVESSGTCRASRFHSCLAHLGLGVILLVLGLFTLARYLGVWARHGWAWNEISSSRPSFETLECGAVFAYGAFNVSYAHLTGGVDPSSPHHFQHYLLWVFQTFAGALGLALESRACRRLVSPDLDAPAGVRPNPIPLAVFALTGIAMGGHQQAILFSFQIHQLFGSSLMAFASLRLGTYALLWSRPSTGESPSRPFTEVLAALALTASAAFIMLANEEVVLAAKLREIDDPVLFLLFTLGLSSLSLFWTLVCIACSGDPIGLASRRSLKWRDLRLRRTSGERPDRDGGWGEGSSRTTDPVEGASI